MEKDSSITSDDDDTGQSVQSRPPCAVCGAPSIGRNFDAMTCLSSFFRRNAYNENLIYTCRIRNSCPISSITRRHCSACRLKKCFHQGMKKELIRSLNAINNATSTAIINRPPPPPQQHQSLRPTTIDSIPQTNRSVLSSHDWTLLTNIRGVYEEYCVNKFIESHEIIPLIPPIQPYRSRIKLQRLLDLRYKYTIIVASFIKRILQLDSFHISSEHHYHYLKTSFPCLTSVNVSELMKSKVLEFLPWEHDQLVVQAVLSDEIILRAETILNAFQTFAPYDPFIMKLWVIILALSSQTMPLIKKDQYIARDFDSMPKNLLTSQNYYLTLLWKYVIYRLGYNNGINFLVRFIQNFLRRQKLEADVIEVIQNRDDHGQLIQFIQMNLTI
ncbi:unnamed protein product [Adineta steineri]|uniref:Nuclear receptor domain-containing protein n=1 Tax=Adineta steineri TaxID=433720 RepID=A0A813V531_9BILA|nr:unnamed protein product [Adineta steineri]